MPSWGWRWGGYALFVLVGGALLASWEGLQRTLWWYPESNAYQVWVALLLVAAAGSFWLGPGQSNGQAAAGRQLVGWLLEGAWHLLSAFALSGLLRLSHHIIAEHTPGDMLQGYLAGARRRAAGQTVYDQRGLDQSVNAPPLVIACALPLAQLSDAAAIKVFLGWQWLLLLLYLITAARWIGQLKGRILPSDVGLALCGLTTFFSFQRSWRLGQLDLLMLTLLLAAISWGAREGRLRQVASAGAAALAAAFKLAPAVLIGRRLLAVCDRTERRWLQNFALALVLLGAVAVIAIGPRQALDFARNLPNISAGTTSGNNYSLAARVLTWGDRDRRAAHHPLSTEERLFQRALAAAALILLVLLVRQLKGAPAELADGLWLAAIPLLAPVTWDIYLVWCGFLPWWLLWVRLSASYQRRPSRQLQLLAVLAVGGYLIAGTAGNTMYRDLASGVRVQLELPPWLDGMPLWGHLLTLVTLVAASFHLRKPESEADQP